MEKEIEFWNPEKEKELLESLKEFHRVLNEIQEEDVQIHRKKCAEKEGMTLEEYNRRKELQNSIPYFQRRIAVLEINLQKYRSILKRYEEELRNKFNIEPPKVW